MDFDGAIQSHANCKLRLLNSARGRSQGLQTQDACELGDWLSGEGKKFANDPRFGKLWDAHSSFHASAVAIGAWIAAGDTTAALAQLKAADSELNRQSFRLTAALLDLADLETPLPLVTAR